MTAYLDWGFSQNPFDTTALPPTELGETLLVGREAELRLLTAQMRTPPRVPTVEGPNGVGKTSLINVAAYRAYRKHTESGIGSLLIPSSRPFQLHNKTDLESFSADVLMEVAQTLISRRNDLRKHGRTASELKSLDRWLNSAQLNGWQASGGLLLGSFGIGVSPQQNEGAGFERSGFRREVTQVLQDIFDPGEGVVCVIDNLELLETSDNARRTLEQLRDSLFQLPGIRWVLAGAAGIVHGIASSPRLEGYLARPIELKGMDPKHAREIILSRVSAFARDLRTPPFLPITTEDFAFLYNLLAQNLRSTLGRADNYCMSVIDRPPRSDEERHTRFMAWLDQEGAEAEEAADKMLNGRAWRVFDQAALEFNGSFSPSDFDRFGFKSPANLRAHVRDLESSGLVAATQDESDKRRKTIQIVAKGWLVNYARSKRRSTPNTEGQADG